MSRQFDWNAEATRAADAITDTLFRAHRGALPWEHAGVTALFGNDGYEQDPRARDEVARVRAALRAGGVPELGFGTDTGEHYTWVLLARTDDVGRMHQLVWDAWSPVRDAFRVVQGGIAASTVAEHLPDERIHPN